VTTTQPPQKVLQGTLHTENESKQNHKRTVVSNHMRREDKESENNIDSVAHNQTFKQQKKLNDRNNHIPININTECQQTQLPHQNTPFGKLD
jgi:hypothetical protein